MTDKPGYRRRLAITGQVVDGNGDVVNDAMLEVWQANAADADLL
jgi:protocatechuate 3,4-dioxygenase beta subunit